MKRYLLALFIIIFLFPSFLRAQSNQTVTNGDTTASVNFPGAGCIYNWVNDTPGIGLAASGTGNIGSFTAVNNTNSPVTATITATATTAVNAYIPNSDNPGIVTVINTATNTVVTNIPVGGAPVGVSASPDGSRVYIANTFSNNVSVINTATNTVAATIPVGNFPNDVSVSYDGNEVYVANVNDATVSVINTKTNKVTATITGFSQPFFLAASPAGNLLYVANSNSGTVSVVNTLTRTVDATIPVGGDPWQLIVSPDGSKVYVVDLTGNSVSVINTATNKVTATIGVGLTPEGVTLSPDGSLLYVGCFNAVNSNFNAGNVTVINTSNYDVIKTIITGSPQGMSLTSDGNWLYVVNNLYNSVTALNAATGVVIATIPLNSHPSSFGNFIAAGAPCDPVKFTITVNPSPALPPAISVSLVTGTISACAGSASASPQLQQFIVSGSSLTGNIAITAPNNFEISLSTGSGFGSSLTLAQTGGTVKNTTIYVRSAASAPAGDISDNLTVTSPGASTLMPPVSATINALPTVNPVGNQSINNGAPTTAVNFAGTGNTFNWMNDTPGIGLPASGTGYIPSFTAVNTGSSPVTAAITVTPLHVGFIYVPNSGDGTVSVFSAATNVEVAVVNVGQFPFGVAVNREGTMVYITNQFSNNISVINTLNNTVSATIAVGTYPTGVAVSPDGSRVYVTNYEDNTISIINTATNLVLSTIAVGPQPLGISVSPDGSLVYIANSYSNTVSVLQTATNTISAAIIVGDHPFGVCFSPDGAHAYVTNQDGQSVNVINTATNAVIATITVGISPYGICSSIDGKHIYVANLSSSSVSVISTSSNSVVATIPVSGLPYGICVSPDGNSAYVVTRRPGGLSIINLVTNTVSAVASVGLDPYSFGNFVAAGSSCTGIPAKFTITVNPTPELAPAISVSPVSGAISACTGTASASPNIQQFTVSGTNLTANIVVAAPAGFEVSLNANSGYGNSVTLEQLGGAVSNAVVYVRSAVSDPPGAISGNVTLTSAGIASPQVAVTGYINALPVLSTVSDQTFINGATTSGVHFKTTANTVNWINDTPGIGLAASGTGDIAPFMALNTGSNPVVATITATPLSAAYAYVANAISNNVSVINIANNSVVATILAGNYPCGVAISPDGSAVYVANQRSNTVSVISTASNTVISTISMGGLSPNAVVVSPDGKRIYVVNLNSNNISVINTVNNSLVTTIGVGGYPVGVAITPDGSKVYVTNSSNSITVINAVSNSVKTTIPEGNSPNGVAISPDGSKVYVAISGDNNVSVISTSTDAIIATIPVGAGPAGVTISPDGSRVYVADQTANNVSVIDAPTNAVISAIPVGSDPVGISVTSDGSEVYAVNQKSNNVSVISTSSNAVTSTIGVGSYPISLGNFITAGTGCSGVPVTFTITVDPTTSASIGATGTLSPLYTTYGTPSSSASFNISGNGLTTGILVSPPAGFEVSADDLNFAANVTIGSAGAVAAPVYIRLAATTPAGNYSGNIKLSSTAVTDVNTPMPVSTVSPALLTIIADDKSRVFGAANPVLTASYIGFVNFETAANLTVVPVLSTTAVASSPAGQYPISVSGASSPNYAITFIPGTLTVLPAGRSIVIPNTFTPNGDGINDTWDIKYLDSYSNCSVDIYNRYGEKVYSSIGYGIPWDGTYKGTALPGGTYYYIINLRNDLKVLSGFVAIIR